MPSISKIRFTNVVYENGNKRYNDDIFEFDGNNSAIILENGGGKTVWIQTALQAITLNTAIANRKIKNTLSLENSPAHIAIEWIIKDKPRRYALTAATLFMKNNDVESIKYVYEYEDGDNNSIENLPFVLSGVNDSKRPSSREEINEYYQEMNKNKMNAKVFSSKKDYSNYIETNFKIIPSEWAKIAMINSAEGGVEEFFDKCKTNAQLIDNLIIPTVEDAIEGNGTQNFVEIFENQREHLKKQKELQNKINESREVSNRINKYVDVYEKYDEALQKADNKKAQMKEVYEFIQNERINNEKAISINDEQIDNNNKAKNNYDKKRASFELKKLEDEMNDKKVLYEECKDDYEKALKNSHDAAQKYYNIKNIIFKTDIKDKQDSLAAHESELKLLDVDVETRQLNAELEENSRELSGYYHNEKKKLDNRKENINKTINEENDKLNELNDKISQITKKKDEKVNEKSQNKGNIDCLEKDIKRIKDTIISNSDKENIQELIKKWLDKLTEIENNLYSYMQQRSELKNQKEILRNNIDKLKEKNKNLNDEKSQLNHEYESINEKIDEILPEIRAFKPLWFNFQSDSIYIKQETIQNDVERKLEILRNQKEESIMYERNMHRYSDDYKDREFFTSDANLEKLIKNWRSDIPAIESGTEYINNYASTHDISIDELMNKYSYWPVTVIVPESEMHKLIEKVQKNKDINQPVIVLSDKEAKQRIMEDRLQEDISNVIIPDLWRKNSDDKLFEEWKKEIERNARESTSQRKEKENEFNNTTRLFDSINKFYSTYPHEVYKDIKNKLDICMHNLENTENEIKANEEKLSRIDEKLENINNKENNDKQEKNTYENNIQKGRECIEKVKQAEEVKFDNEKIQKEIEYLEHESEKLNKDLRELSDEIADNKSELIKVKGVIQNLIKEELYEEVKSYIPIESNTGINVLKTKRKTLKDSLEGKNKNRNVILEKIKNAKENLKSLNNQYEEFKNSMDDEIKCDDTIEILQSDRDNIDKILKDKMELKKNAEKINNKFYQLLQEVNLKQGAFDNQKESYLKQYDSIIVFNKSDKEVEAELEQEIKEITRKKKSLEDESSRLNSESKKIEESIKYLDLANAKEDYKITSKSVYELTEEEMQRIPYNRTENIKAYINEYYSILDDLKNEDKNVNNAKEVFIRFCEDNISDIKFKDISIKGVKNKNTLKDIKTWQNMSNEHINRAIEIAENNMKEHDKEKQQFINHIHTYLLEVCEQLQIIPKKTRIKVEGDWKDIFVFDVPSWDEKEGKQRISDHIDYIVTILENNQFNDSEKIRNEVEKHLRTKELLKVVMLDKDIKVKCRKVTNDGKMRSALFSWEISNSWSGGEKWSKNMSLFLGILNYTAEKRVQLKSGFSKKNNRCVIVDNPFGKASSEHVLDPVFFIAEQLGFQIIALTAHAEGKFIRSYFPVVYSLKLRSSSNNETKIITKEKEVKSAYFKDNDYEGLVRLAKVEQKSFFNE